MLGVLLLAFLVVPFLELFVILEVGQAIGVLETIALLIVVSVVGAALVRREGFGVIRRAQRQLDLGRVPTRELLDGIFILLAGALLLTPGFVTDAVGILLLLPPVRAVLRRAGARYIRRHVVIR